MPTLKQFAERIKEVAARTEKNTDREVVKAAGACLSAVVVSTPVDTGRARGNWLVSIAKPITSPVEQFDKVGAGTITEGRGRIERYKGGSTIYICNNVPYIGKLNNGSSAQAPANFVELAVREAIRSIQSARIVKGR